MSWDWEKLKQQQKMGSGGVPPQMDELVKKVKGFKLPGGPLLIGLIIIALIVWSAVYTVKQMTKSRLAAVPSHSTIRA